MRPSVAAIILILASAHPALAQSPSPSRVEAFADLGYARTWDDEGFLGSGAALSGGVGFPVTDRTTILGIVSRIPYYRDIEYLTFDGRVVFAGAEASFRSTRPSVRPFFTIGAGMFNDRGIWIRKTFVDPAQPRVEETIDRRYRLGAFTTSGGIDFRVTDRASVRASLRLYGLLQTGEGRDLAPHSIIQPSVGFAYRW